MALEPITRQEQIIAGKDLEPITRMEKFLKEYGGGGGGGSASEYFETVGGDTLTWDGNTDGLYNIFGMFYHVSDIVPTIEDLKKGGVITHSTPADDAGDYTFDETSVMDLEAMGAGKDCYIIMTGTIYAVGVVLKDGATATLEGMIATFEKAGVYFLCTPLSSGENRYTSKFTINGYTGFTTTKLKEEYLPEQSSGVTTFYSGDNHKLYLDPYQDVMAKKSDIITAMKKGVIRIGDGDGDSGTYEHPISIDTVSDSAYITIVKWTDNSVTTDYFVTAEEFEG